MRAFLYAALLGQSHACSCLGPHWLRPGEPLRSVSLKYMAEPLVFQGEVLSVEAAEHLPPPDGDVVCHPVTGRCAPDDRWRRCTQAHHARVKVTHGFKGIETGDIFTYNCTLASCGDCSPPCPEVGSKLLDATKPGGPGPRSFCGMIRCDLGARSPHADCKKILADLHMERPIKSKLFQFPLSLPFSALGRYDFEYDCALRGILKDVLKELKSISRFDVFQLDVVEDGDATLARLQFHFENSTSLEQLEHLGSVDWTWPTLRACCNRRVGNCTGLSPEGSLARGAVNALVP